MPTTIYTYESISGSQWNNPSYAARDDGNRASYTANANSSIPAITASGSMYCSSGTDIIGMANVTISKVEFGMKGYVSGSNCTLNLECYPPGASWSSGGSTTATSETTIWSDKTSAITWTVNNIDDTQARVSGSNSDSKNTRTAYVNCFLLRVTWTWAKAYTGSGDLAFSGSATTGIVFSCTGSGGIEFSGAATALLAAIAYVGAGGIAFGGAAGASISLAYVGSGGIALSGSATTKIGFTYTGTGGVAFSGSATTGIVFSCIGQGGITFSGSAVTRATASFVYQGSGTFLFQGAAVTGIVLSYTGQGGISFSGAAQTAMGIGYSYVGSGGIALSGAAVTGMVFAVIGSGGLVFSGTATTSYICIYAFVGSGSLSFSGNALARMILSWIGSGGIIFTGNAASSWSAAFSCVGSGGIVFSGSSQSGLLLSYTGSGCIEFTGAAATALITPAVPGSCLTSTSRDLALPLTGYAGARPSVITGGDTSSVTPLSVRAGVRPSCVTVTTRDSQDAGYRAGARVASVSCTDTGQVPPFAARAGMSLVLASCTMRETGGLVVASTALRYTLIPVQDSTTAPPCLVRAGYQGSIPRGSEAMCHPAASFHIGSRISLPIHGETTLPGTVIARSSAAGVTITAMERTIPSLWSTHAGSSMEGIPVADRTMIGLSFPRIGSRQTISPLSTGDEVFSTIAVTPASGVILTSRETSVFSMTHHAGTQYRPASLSIEDLFPGIDMRSGARVPVTQTTGYDVPLPITILTAHEIHLLVNSIISIDRTGPHSPIIIPVPPAIIKDRVRYRVHFTLSTVKRSAVTKHVTLKAGLRRTLRVKVAGHILLRPGNEKESVLWIYPDDAGVSLVIECSGSIETFDTVEILIGSPCLAQTLVLPARREGRSTILGELAGTDLQGGLGHYIIYGRLRKTNGVVLHTDPIALQIRPYWTS